MEERLDIVCGLCSCRFTAAKLDDEDQLCAACGHSLYDDHAALRREATSSRRRREAAYSYLK